MDLELIKGLNTDLATWVKEDYQESLASIIGHFLAQTKTRSKKTYISYKQNLIEFFHWASINDISIVNIEDINHKLLDAYIDSQMKKNTIQASTIWHRIAVVSSLFEFCLDRRHTHTPNPTKLLRRPKGALKPAFPTLPLTDFDRKLILTYLKEILIATQKYPHSMDHRSAILRLTIFRLLLSIGMRSEELANLKIGSIARVGDRLQLRMILKGQKPHQVLVPRNLAGILERYRVLYRKGASLDDPYLVSAKHMGFWSANQPRISAQIVSRIVTQIAQKAGVRQKITAHSIRATTASLLWQQGQSIQKIQKLLGHSNPKTTWLYISRFVDVSESNALEL